MINRISILVYNGIIWYTGQSVSIYLSRDMDAKKRKRMYRFSTDFLGILYVLIEPTLSD